MANHLQPLPQVQAPGDGRDASGAGAKAIPSEIPTLPVKFSAKEKKVWNHVTAALHEYGLIHRTDAFALTVICRTYVRWVEAEEALSDYMAENDGSYMVKTPNGFEQPHQILFVAQRFKKELLQWLPEAALTVLSFAKAVEASPNSAQGTLFDDPVEKHQAGKPRVMRMVS
jgi:P27 family predicted phage terminase small subunit